MPAEPQQPVSPRYGDGYGRVSPQKARYGGPAGMAAAAAKPPGARAAQPPRQAPLSPRGDRLSLNMSPRWSAPTLTPRLHPDDIATNVRQSSYIRSKQVVPPEYAEIIKPAAPPAPLRPTPRELAQKRAAAKAAAEAEAAKIAAAEAAKAAEAAAAAARTEAAAAAARAAAEAEAQAAYSYSDTEEEEEEEEGDEMDDAFDEQMLMMVQSRNRGGAGRAGGDRRVSHARS